MSLYRFLVRGGTAANLTAVNEVPLARELIIATDAGVRDMRLGNGTDNWADLPNLLQKEYAPSFSYTVETGSTADSDPGAGLVKWNNATQGSATFLYIDDVTADTATDLSTYFSTLATNSSAGFIHIIQANDSAKWQIWKWTAITDGTGYFKFAVTLMASAASFSDAAGVRVTFHPMPAGSGSSGAMTLVGTATVAGSAATTLTLSGLDLAADGRYLIQFSFGNATASNSDLRLFYNSDTTLTNYYILAPLYSSGAVAVTAANTAAIAGMNASTWVDGRIMLWRGQDSKTVARAETMRDARTSMRLQDFGHVWNTTTNPTSITLSATVANSLSVGSYFRVWKIT